MTPCGICDGHAVDSIPVSFGKVKSDMPLCRPHLDESDELGIRFDDKYAQQIERWIIEHGGRL